MTRVDPVYGSQSERYMQSIPVSTKGSLCKFYTYIKEYVSCYNLF